jgi:hypothetical protein
MAKKRRRTVAPQYVPTGAISSFENLKDTIDNRLEEIHSDEAVIANAEEKQAAMGVDNLDTHIKEAVDLANSAPPSEAAMRYLEAEKRSRKRKPVKKAEEDFDDFANFIAAQKRHGIHGKIQRGITSNIKGTQDMYMIGLDTEGQAFIFIYDHGHSAMMPFGPKALEELKWKIDEILVEMGLQSIGVASENEHKWSSASRRKG